MKRGVFEPMLSFPEFLRLLPLELLIPVGGANWTWPEWETMSRGAVTPA